jgi:hypothetical protein
MGYSRKHALKRLDALLTPVKEHVEKLSRDASAADKRHWQREIENWLEQMENVLPYVGDKTAIYWRKQIGEIKQAIEKRHEK